MLAFQHRPRLKGLSAVLKYTRILSLTILVGCGSRTSTTANSNPGVPTRLIGVRSIWVPGGFGCLAGSDLFGAPGCFSGSSVDWLESAANCCQISAIT